MVLNNLEKQLIEKRIIVLKSHKQEILKRKKHLRGDSVKLIEKSI